jgi:hypothetical protein
MNQKASSWTRPESRGTPDCTPGRRSVMRGAALAVAADYEGEL